MTQAFGKTVQDSWPETAAIRQHVISIASDLGRLPHSCAKIPLEMSRLGRAVGDLARRNAMTPGDGDAVKAQVIRSWIASWSRIESLLQTQVSASACPLFPEDEGPLSPRRFQAHLADLAAQRQHRLLNPLKQDAGSEAEGAFSDIVLPLSVFLENLHAACRVLLALGRQTNRGFADLGCGCGEKLLAAASCFERVTGVELDPGYAALARDIVRRAGLGKAEIVEMDARDYDGCAGQDLIYFYRPMRYPQPLAQLEQRVVDTCRPGTLLIAPYEGFRHRAKDLGCAHLGGYLYIAGLDDSDVEALRQRAERIGPHVKWEGPKLPEIWGPVLEASRRRGFVP